MFGAFMLQVRNISSIRYCNEKYKLNLKFNSKLQLKEKSFLYLNIL